MHQHLRFGILLVPILGNLSFSMAQEGMEAWTPNVTSFSAPVMADPEVLAGVSSMTDHPEYGILPKDAPCSECVEILEERTPDYRYFVDAVNPGIFYVQKFMGDTHFPDADGYLRSYDSRMVMMEDGLYRTRRQIVPAQIDISKETVGFQTAAGSFWYNRKLQLKHALPGSTTTNLGYADWSTYTIGDEGIRVIDIWPGIDLVVGIQREEIKTDFIVKEPLGLSGGYLIIEDHPLLPTGYLMEYDLSSGYETAEGWRGKILVNPDAPSLPSFEMERVVAFDQSGIRETIEDGYYKLKENGALEIRLSMDWLSDPERIYPIIIDPLVTSSATYSAGSMEFRFNGAWCGGVNNCNYDLVVPLPANCTLTGATLDAQYRTVAGSCAGSCIMADAGFYVSGPCDDSPGGGLFWSCWPLAATGYCTGAGIAMNQTIDCLTPVCSGNITYTMRNSYCYCNADGTDCAGALPCQRMNNNTWVITLTGRNLETLGDAVDGSGSMVVGPDCCVTTNLNPDAEYGVPPYTYLWSPSGSVLPDTTVFSCGDGTWVYTCLVTDACGVSRTATFSMTVDDCGLLPIELTKFTATALGNLVNLTWETSSELNNAYFLLEKAGRDGHFSSLAEIPGAGTTQTAHQYYFTDIQPFEGVNYYRLNMVDMNGTLDPAGIVDVWVNGVSNVDFLHVYPNPSDKKIQILSSFESDVEIQVLNSEGRIMETLILPTEGTMLNIENYPKGLYNIQATGFSKASTSFLKQ